MAYFNLSVTNITGDTLLAQCKQTTCMYFQYNNWIIFNFIFCIAFILNRRFNLFEKYFDTKQEAVNYYLVSFLLIVNILMFSWTFFLEPVAYILGDI